MSKRYDIIEEIARHGICPLCGKTARLGVDAIEESCLPPCLPLGYWPAVRQKVEALKLTIQSQEEKIQDQAKAWNDVVLPIREMVGSPVTSELVEAVRRAITQTEGREG